MSMEEKAVQQQIQRVLSDAFKALAAQERLQARVKRLEEQVKKQTRELLHMGLIERGYRSICAERVDVCEKCDGVGAYLVAGEVEECDQCDSLGFLIKRPI